MSPNKHVLRNFYGLIRCKSFKSWLPGLVLAFAFQLSFAQNIIPRFEGIGVNDGLSQSSVYAIYQDRQGFMWFGTADGLNRFDGHSIKVFKVTDNPVANSNSVRGTICEDKKGNIWYTNETGIFCLDVATEILTRRHSLTQAYQASGVFIDAAGRFWMLCANGVSYFDTGTGDWKQYPHQFILNNKNATGFRWASDGKDNIWFKVNGFGIYHFNIQTKQYTHNLPDIPVSCLTYHKGKLYYWCNSTLYIADASLKTISKKHFEAAKRITMIVDILPDNYNRLWFTTSNSGILCYDVKGDRLDVYRHDNARQKSLAFDITRCLYIDKFDNLWIGTDGGGLSRLDLKPARFNLFPLNEGDYAFLNNYFIKCFYEDEQDRIWFGTQDNGLNIFDPRDRSVKHYPANNNPQNGISGAVSAIFKDAEGNMWLGSSMGIYRFNEQKGTYIATDISAMPTQYLGPNINFPIRFLQLRSGQIIVATCLGLYYLEKDANDHYKVTDLVNERLQGLTMDVIEMPDNSLYVAVPGTGLYHLEKEGNAYINKGVYCKGPDIRSLHADERDRNLIWVSTGVGLIKFNIQSKTSVTYTTANGLANDYVYGVLEDKTHNLWLSTNGGLSYFDRKNNGFQNYTVSDGLQSNEFNTGAFYKSARGTLYFGGIKGFNWFNPETLYNGRHKPAVAITAVMVDDKPFKTDSGAVHPAGINLPYDKNSLSFSFAALDYTMPSANKIAYMLTGVDNNWIITTNKNVRYAKLVPGRYRFLVKAANGDGVWSDVQQINIAIEAPFWQRTWFFVLVGLCVIALIVYITRTLSQIKIKKRLRALERRHAIDAERNRISRDMHDEIGSGLTHIALLSELIQAQHKTDAVLKNEVGNISASARKLITNMSEIIWALNPQNDSLENLLAYTREQMQQLFQPFDMVLEIDFADDVPDVPLTNEQRRNLYLVTKEALNNAMKHAKATLVKLSFKISDGELQFTVADNGCGLPEGKQKLNCNGLKNMQKRMEDIGGELDIQSSAGGLTLHYGLHL